MAAFFSSRRRQGRADRRVVQDVSRCARLC